LYCIAAIEFIKANSVAARAHVFIMALSLMMFTVSLWMGVIILRRLNNNTASSLELQIFANEDVQQAWQKEIEMGLPR
jgi:cell division protein FtsX